MDDTTRGPGPPTRDIIVIGASAGGLTPLQRLLHDLPADLPAAVFIVLHVGGSSHLADILSRAGKLPVLPAQSGQPIRRGQVHVAVPGKHLLLHDSHLLLRRGPRENLARPAVDPLFRSAACTFGARVVGVILSGALNDGTAGLLAVKRCGGIAIVQDPAEAAYPDMPASALCHVPVDHVAPIEAMGSLLARLSRERAGATPPIPPEIRLETAIAAQELAGMAVNDRLGRPSRFTCPECHGTLWEIDDRNLLRYRCHVGHAYTAETILARQAVQAEEMMWGLMRGHQERAELARRMAAQERERHNERLAKELEQRAAGYDEDADVIGRLLHNNSNVNAAGELSGSDAE